MVTQIEPAKAPGSEPLENKRHEKLCHLIAMHPETSKTKLYRRVYPKSKSPAAATAITRLLKEAEIVNRVVYLRRPREKAREEEVYMTIDFKRRFLKEVVETPIGKVTKNSRIANRIQFTTTTSTGEILEQGEDEDDEPVRKDETKTTTTIWIPDKLKAMELDSKLSGELTPEKNGEGPTAATQLFIINLSNGTLKPSEQLTLEVGEHQSVKQVKGKIIK